MRAHNLSIFLIISLLTSLRVQLTNGAQSNRRILHQPLFPVDSTPPPPSLPPPPTPDIPDEGQPFSSEVPAEPTFDQSYQPPPLPDIGTSVATPAAAIPPPSNSNTIKKLLIATSSTLVTVGMLFFLALFLYKNRGRQRHNDSQKLVGENLQRIDEESRVPPPAFLCIETAEPSSNRGLVNDEANVASGSPYQKLDQGKRFNHYRPSPDLQPLPPLTKPPPPPRMSSPPPMSSSDDETHEARFYAPGGTSSSNESPSSRYYNVSNKSSHVSKARPDNLASRPVPHSKRTPPKSRFSASSPETRPAMVPSVKQSLPLSPPPPTSLGSLQSCKPLPFSPNRTKFSASPPSPSIEQCRSMTNYEHKASKIPIPHPPPPPPPPPPTSMTRKYGTAKTYTFSPVFKQTRRSKSKSPSPKASPLSEKTRPLEEVSKGGRSTEKLDAENKEGPRTKMKPLHWDKVRATADRAKVERGRHGVVIWV